MKVKNTVRKSSAGIHTGTHLLMPKCIKIHYYLAICGAGGGAKMGWVIFETVVGGNN